VIYFYDLGIPSNRTWRRTLMGQERVAADHRGWKNPKTESVTHRDRVLGGSIAGEEKALTGSRWRRRVGFQSIRLRGGFRFVGEIPEV